MSGDVQPRKRKDKKKKKDDLGVEEPRGTAAALGEGDVFMHSYHDHGTGGHWCAKIIFFSLLAVLVTLIGLIILENRGLSELEANSVESRYSGVLEGWIEDAVDDHHDEHTLELKHHDDEDHIDDQIDENEAEDESLEEEIEHDDDGEEEDEDQNDDIYDNDDDKDESENDNDPLEDEIEENDDSNEEADDQNDMYDDDEGDESDNEDDEKEMNDDDDEENEIKGDDDEIQYDKDDDSDEKDDVEANEDSKYEDNEDNEEENYISNIDEVDEDDMKFQNYHENHAAYESEENKYDDSNNLNEDEADEIDENDDDEDEQEIEKIEKEVIDDSEEYEDAGASKEEEASKEDIDRDDSDEDEPPIEQISRPQAGKPFVEIEEESPVKPVDTLAEEEAYERQQEELRRQEEEKPHSVWLKVFVGGALLAATHAVLRRSNVPQDTSEENMTEEAPTFVDRRMTIIEEPIEVMQTTSQTPQLTDDHIFKRPAPVQSALSKPRIEEEIVKKAVQKVLESPKTIEKTEEEKELYSEEEDEEEDVEEDEDLEEDKTPKKEVKKEEEDEPEPEEVSDVEIIYDETIEEEEDGEEEEISDVDDAELLSRLEAKYGRLPEPERPGQYKGGAKSVSSEWPGEPSDAYWRSQLDTAEEDLRQGAWSACITRLSDAELWNSGRARWLKARALDLSAESTRDNQMLSRAITAYLHLLKMNDKLSDDKLLEVALRTIDRMQFRGVYLNAEPVYRLLIRRFPDDVTYRNNLTISFLMANRADLADEVLRETLRLWPNDRVALGHHGYILKNHYNNLEEAVRALKKALEGDVGEANEQRFYYHLGDALLLLGRFDEAYEVHKRGAEQGHFLSASQRSLYNVPRLKSRPWWRIEDTPYEKLARALEKSWRDILEEGQRLRYLYEQEKEGLMDKGEWSQMDIMVQGREIPGRCARAPVTCSVVKTEPAAAGCRRGQVKFSMMEPGTHVRPHVGPTNCRLRMHLGLSNTKDTYIRVDKETRQWQVGKTLLFDDSFEHEVWHNGTGARLVLIVDVWHPDLTPAEKRQLPSI